MTWKRHSKDNYLKSLDISLAPVEEADFLFFHGSQVIATNAGHPSSDISMEVFRSGRIDALTASILSVACERGIPAVCANIDASAVLANGQLAFMPGLLKEAYEKMGGKVISFGKPHKDFFQRAIEIGSAHFLSAPPSTRGRGLNPRVIHVGDSLHHDIAGDILHSYRRHFIY